MAKALNYYDVRDVQALIGISSSKAYKIMQELNQELKAKGYIIVAGKIPKKFFNERFYCSEDDLKATIG